MLAVTVLVVSALVSLPLVMMVCRWPVVASVVVMTMAVVMPAVVMPGAVMVRVAIAERVTQYCAYGSPAHGIKRVAVRNKRARSASKASPNEGIG